MFFIFSLFMFFTPISDPVDVPDRPYRPYRPCTQRVRVLKDGSVQATLCPGPGDPYTPPPLK